MSSVLNQKGHLLLNLPPPFELRTHFTLFFGRTTSGGTTDREGTMRNFLWSKMNAKNFTLYTFGLLVIGLYQDRLLLFFRFCL